MQKINEWWRTKFKNITLTRKMLLVYAVFAGFFFGVSILAFQGSTDVLKRNCMTIPFGNWIIMQKT